MVSALHRLGALRMGAWRRWGPGLSGRADRAAALLLRLASALRGGRNQLAVLLCLNGLLCYKHAFWTGRGWERGGERTGGGGAQGGGAAAARGQRFARRPRPAGGRMPRRSGWRCAAAQGKACIQAFSKNPFSHNLLRWGFFSHHAAA